MSRLEPLVRTRTGTARRVRQLLDDLEDAVSARELEGTQESFRVWEQRRRELENIMRSLINILEDESVTASQRTLQRWLRAGE